MADELGLPLAEEKTDEPVTSLTFVGIELDTVHQTSRLPDSKLVDLKARTALICKRKKNCP